MKTETACMYKEEEREEENKNTVLCPSVRPTATLSSARTVLIFRSRGVRKEGKAPQNK